jgi:hypothetical protein
VLRWFTTLKHCALLRLTAQGPESCAGTPTTARDSPPASSSHASESGRARLTWSASVFWERAAKVSAITDVLTDSKSQVAVVIVSVSKFLGVNEKPWPFQSVPSDSRNGPHPALSYRTERTAASPGAQVPSNITLGDTHRDSPVSKWIMLSMTKEQLHQAPAFRDNLNVEHPIMDEAVSPPTTKAPPYLSAPLR